MSLEELIYTWFVGYESVSNLMAVFSGVPAIFYQLAPDDRQTGWDSKTQYPRIVYTVDMQANQERKSAGTMLVSILCDEAGELMPEDIEPRIKDCLKDLIIKPDEESPYCFAWAGTEGFEIPSRETGGVDTRVAGLEITFDILEYPAQETTNPDPIIALNRYIKNRIPEAFVIGVDHVERFKVTKADAPVFYCRLEFVEKAKETNTVVWMEGRIAVHVICSEAGIRQKMTVDLANNLSLDGEVIMLDYSPVFILRLQMNNRADYLKDGQLGITVRYGLLRHQEKKHGLVAGKIIINI